MRSVIRAAQPDDHATLAAIGAEGGSPDGDDGYFEFVSGAGRLLVAQQLDTVVGFAGMVAVGEAAMVTDLFVAASARSGGIGRTLLAAVLDGYTSRMTFSSTHPSALALYESFGMTPRWRLLTLCGVASGGGPPLPDAPWTHTRADLVAYFESCGARVCGDVVVMHEPGEAHVLRIDCEEPDAAVHAALRAFAAGTRVTLSLPEQELAVASLLDSGFVEVDHDICCSTDDVNLSPAVSCVHRGLC